MFPQEDVVYLSLTVQENLHFAARIQLGSETDATELERAVEQALEGVGLTEHANKLTFVLSGGHAERLSVAVELLKRPRILLLDEPTSGLDPASEANLMEAARPYVASRGTTVICTTHLMENVRLLDSLIVVGVKDGVGRSYGGPLPSFWSISVAAILRTSMKSCRPAGSSRRLLPPRNRRSREMGLRKSLPRRWAASWHLTSGRT